MEHISPVLSMVKDVFLFVIAFGGAWAIFTKFNPLDPIKKKLEDHEKRIKKNEEGVTIVKTAIETHQDAFSESQYVMLKAIKALLDHAVNPLQKTIEKASQELEDYLLKK